MAIKAAREIKPFKGYTSYVKARAYLKWKAKKLSDRKQIYEVPHSTTICNAKESSDAVARILGKIKRKKVLVNNIGFGLNFFNTGKTYEPFFIAKELEEAGKDYQINAYALGPKEVRSAKRQRTMNIRGIIPELSELMQLGRFKASGKTTSKHYVSIPKEILKKISFAQLDLITETPAKQADITVMKGVPYLGQNLTYTDKELTLLKNAVDSTKRGGYIICNPLQETISTSQRSRQNVLKRYRLKEVDEGIYQKL